MSGVSFPWLYKVPLQSLSRCCIFIESCKTGRAAHKILSLVTSLYSTDVSCYGTCVHSDRRVIFGADEEADLEAEERQPDGGDLSDWLTKVEQQEPPPSDSAVEPPPIKQSESWTMRIMSGEQAEIVVLETERTPASSATGFEFWRPGGFGQNPSTDESEPETQDDLQQEEPVTEDEPAAEGVPNVGEPPASQEEETEPDS